MHDFEPVIVTLLRRKRLVAVLPLERIRTRARTVLAPLGHAFSQYSDALVARARSARRRSAPAAGRHPGSALRAVSFLKVRSDSVLARGMPANHIVTG